MASVSIETRSIPTAKRPPAGGRHLALLGGTTTLSDGLLALRYLATPAHLVEGPAIRTFEHAFAREVGTRFAFSFSAGRVGLYGLLQALGVGPGDDVLLQVPTHIVVANAIRFSGARPVFLDCDLDSYNVDLEEVARRITPRSKVLLLQHTFGIPVDLERARALCDAYGLTLIEDCVHALGATYAGRPVGSFGRASFFSTEETKTISTTMGGMVATDDPVLAEQMARFQARCLAPSAGLTSRYLLKLVVYQLLAHPALHRPMRRLYERLGHRHPLPRPTTHGELRGLQPPRSLQRLSNAQAALGIRQLHRLRANVAHRQKIAGAITDWLSSRGLAAPRAPANGVPALVRFPLWVEDRQEAIRATQPHLVLGTWFTSVLEEALSPEFGGYAAGSCPRAEMAARHLVNLPTHQRVRVEDIDPVLSILAERAGLRTQS